MACTHKTLIKQTGLRDEPESANTGMAFAVAACCLKEEGLVITPYNIIPTNAKKREKQTGREKPVLEPLPDFRCLLN